MKLLFAVIGIFVSCNSFAGYEGQMDDSGLFVTKIECEIKKTYTTIPYEGYFIIDYGSNVSKESNFYLDNIPERLSPYQYFYFPMPFLPSAKGLKEYIINRDPGDPIGMKGRGQTLDPVGYQMKEWACLNLNNNAYIVFRGNGWSGFFKDLHEAEKQRGHIDLEANLVFLPYLIKEKSISTKWSRGCDNFDGCIYFAPHEFLLHKFLLDLEELGLHILKEPKYKKQVEIYNSIVWHPINRFSSSATDAEFEKFQESLSETPNARASALQGNVQKSK